MTVLLIKSCEKLWRVHAVEYLFHILSTLSWPIAKIITRLLNKAVCMRNGNRNVIKVRVLEATQTAEPILRYILPLCPCVSKHSESHLAPKDRKAFHALRRPVLSSRSFLLRMSWELDHCRCRKQRSSHLQSQRAHTSRHHLGLQNQPQRSAQMFLQ